MKRNFTLFITFMVSLIANSLYAQNPKLSELSLKGSTTLTSTQALVSYHNASERLTVNLQSALEGAGFDLSKIDEQSFYIALFDAKSEKSTDELTNQFNHHNGWYLTETFDDATGEETGICVADSSAKSKMYVRMLSYNQTQSVFGVTLGQIAKQLTVEKTYTVSIYIVQDKNAYQVKLELTTQPEKVIQLTDLTKAGETTADLKLNFNTSYKYRKINISRTTLESAEMVFLEQDNQNFVEGVNYWNEGHDYLFYGQESEGIISNNYTSSYGGFWLNKDGYICKYEDKERAVFCEPSYTLGIEELHVGMYPDIKMEGNTYSSVVYIVDEDMMNYYQVNINLTIAPQPTVPECETIEVFDYAMEIVPDATAAHTTDVNIVQEDYMKQAFRLNTEQISELLGEGNYDFRVENILPRGDVITKDYISAQSTNIPEGAGYLMMDTYGLFQIDSLKHTANNFSPLPMLTKAYGISYLDGSLNFWYQPGDRAVGDYYQNTFFLVNFEEGKKIQFNINVLFVEQRNPQIEIVKTIDLTLPTANEEGSDYAATTYSMSTVMDSLNCDDASQIVWMAYNPLAQLYQPSNYDELYGFRMNAAGKMTEKESENVFSVGYTDGEFHTFVSEGQAGANYTTMIVATYQGKGYRFNITLSNKTKEDVNGDGTIDTQDALAVYQFMTTSSDDTFKNKFDVNNDGIVDTQDVLQIYEYMQTH